MSTETIITFGILGLFLLVCVGFAITTIERNRQERKRLESVAKKQAAALHHLLDSFPDAFLGSDLKIVACKSLLDVYDRLIHFDPRNEQYSEIRTELTQRIQELQTNPKQHHYQTMENGAQIAEVKRSLNMLNNFLNQLVQQKKIKAAEAEKYRTQLNQLLTQTSIDTYTIAARQAEGNGKLKLAAHYYKAAIDKLSKEKMEAMYHDHIMGYQERISDLLSRADEEEANAPAPIEEPEDKKKWDQFEDIDPWKKKNVYD